jgi:hypothetical protein
MRGTSVHGFRGASLLLLCAVQREVACCSIVFYRQPCAGTHDVPAMNIVSSALMIDSSSCLGVGDEKFCRICIVCMIVQASPYLATLP